MNNIHTREFINKDAQISVMPEVLNRASRDCRGLDSRSTDCGNDNLCGVTYAQLSKWILTGRDKV